MNENKEEGETKGRKDEEKGKKVRLFDTDYEADEYESVSEDEEGEVEYVPETPLHR